MVMYQFGDLAIITTKNGKRSVAEYTDGAPIDHFWNPVLGFDGLEGTISDPEVSVEVIGHTECPAEGTVETKQEHFYRFYGRWMRGYGPSMDPHRCGHSDEPCFTKVFERTVSEWELVAVRQGAETLDELSERTKRRYGLQDEE